MCIRDRNSSSGRCIETLYLVQAIIGNKKQSRNYNAGKATIWVSDNGKDWTAFEKVRIPYYNKSTIRLKSPIHQPYIRFEFTEAQMKGATSLALKEIKAYGRLSKETGVNGVEQDHNSTDTRIYNLQGQYVGTSIEKMCIRDRFNNAKDLKGVIEKYMDEHATMRKEIEQFQAQAAVSYTHLIHRTYFLRHPVLLPTHTVAFR